MMHCIYTGAQGRKAFLLPSQITQQHLLACIQAGGLCFQSVLLACLLNPHCRCPVPPAGKTDVPPELAQELLEVADQYMLETL